MSHHWPSFRQSRKMFCCNLTIQGLEVTSGANRNGWAAVQKCQNLFEIGTSESELPIWAAHTEFLLFRVGKTNADPYLGGLRCQQKCMGRGTATICGD